MLAEETTISEQILVAAIKIGGWLQSNATRFIRRHGINRLGRCEYLILDLLLRAKGRRAWKRDLQMAAGGRGHNAEVFNRAMRALELSDCIYCDDEETMAGQDRTFVEYANNTKRINARFYNQFSV